MRMQLQEWGSPLFYYESACFLFLYMDEMKRNG